MRSLDLERYLQPRDLVAICSPGASKVPTFQSTSGQWSSVFDWPIIGIHCVLTPDNKILTYGTDQFGAQGAS